MPLGRAAIHTLAILLPAGDHPPREFRLFVQGWNETENGRFLFDQAAAAAVMAAFERHGVDRMIDLEHKSLDPESRNYDPDARGWAKLQLRPDGSLWAVDVTWTPDGEQRLREKRQRYVSPAFLTDPDKRITKIVNIAITAMPATHNTPALVAASESYGNGMSQEQLIAIAEALGMGSDASVEDILATIAAMMAKVQGAVSPAAEEAPAEEAPAPEAEAVPAAEEEKKPEEQAAARALIRLSGKGTLTEAVAELELWRTEREAQAADRAALEAADRCSLVAAMVAMGKEPPATAWADDDAKTPAEPWASMPLAALRARVERLRGKPAPKSPKPAPKPVTNAVELKPRELAMCKRMGIDPAKYAADKAAVAARKVK